MTLKELIEKRNEVATQMKGIVELAKTENRIISEEETNKFNDLEKEIFEIDNTIEKMKKVEDITLLKDEGCKEVKMENKVNQEEIERKAFLNYIRNKVSNRISNQDANLEAGSNGAIVPKTIAKKIITKAYDMSSVLKDATKYNTKGKVSIPVYGANGTNDLNVAYATEFAELESKIGSFTSADLDGFLAGSLAKLSNSLINNTDIDLENKIIELVSSAIELFIEKEILKGTPGKVEGLSTLSNKVTTASATAITAEELIKTKNKVKKRLRKNAKWIVSNDTLTYIESLKDADGRFLFRDDMNGEFDGFILGYPVEVSENMDEIATGKTVAFFGDFSGVALKQKSDDVEINILREKFATQHATGINAWIEFDAKVEDYNKIVKLVCK